MSPSRPVLRRLAAPVVAAALALASAACAELGTDPNEPASIAFNRLPGPSILLRDTLRDSLGVARPLGSVVRVYDADGDVIADVPVRFLVSDTAARLRVTPEGFVVSTDTTARRTTSVQASVGRLVPPPITLAIVPAAPTRIERPAADTNTLRLSFAASSVTETDDVPLRALLRTADDTVEVASWIVQYRIVERPATLDSAWFVQNVGDTATRTTSFFDTTGADGIASRVVRARLDPAAPDGESTLLVEALFRVRGEVVGSVQYPVTIRVQRQAP